MKSIGRISLYDRSLKTCKYNVSYNFLEAMMLTVYATSLMGLIVLYINYQKIQIT